MKAIVGSFILGARIGLGWIPWAVMDVVDVNRRREDDADTYR